MIRADERLSYPFDPPGPGEALAVADGVLWLRLPLATRPDHVNAYALDDGDGWTIVDTGVDSEASRAAWARLRAGPLAGRPVRRVIVTHHHLDHIGLAGAFQAEGAELWTTRTAWLTARMQRLDLNERPPPEVLAFWRRAGMDPAMLATRAEARPFNTADLVGPLPLGYRRIVQGETLTAGGREWRVGVGHGHAPEHATLWGVGHDLVIVGDQVLPGITSNLGVQPIEPEADPVGDWLESCARLARLADDRHLALPGHRRPFHGLPARLAELIAHQQAALDRLADFLAEPRRATDCFETLYGRAIPPVIFNMALAEALGHLNHLHQRGRVTRALGPDGAWRWRRGVFGPDSRAASR